MKYYMEGEKRAPEKKGSVYVDLNYGAGMCLYIQRKVKEAYPAFSYIVDKLDPGHAPSHLKAAECAHMLGRAEKRVNDSHYFFCRELSRSNALL